MIRFVWKFLKPHMQWLWLIIASSINLKLNSPATYQLSLTACGNQELPNISVQCFQTHTILCENIQTCANPFNMQSLYFLSAMALPLQWEGMRWKKHNASQTQRNSMWWSMEMIQAKWSRLLPQTSATRACKKLSQASGTGVKRFVLGPFSSHHQCSCLTLLDWGWFMCENVWYLSTCVTSIPFTPCMSSSPKNAWHSLAYHEAAAFQKLRTAPIRHSTIFPPHLQLLFWACCSRSNVLNSEFPNHSVSVSLVYRLGSSFVTYMQIKLLVASQTEPSSNSEVHLWDLPATSLFVASTNKSRF